MFNRIPPTPDLVRLHVADAARALAHALDQPWPDYDVVFCRAHDQLTRALDRDACKIEQVAPDWWNAWDGVGDALTEQLLTEALHRIQDAS